MGLFLQEALESRLVYKTSGQFVSGPAFWLETQKSASSVGRDTFLILPNLLPLGAVCRFLI